VVPSQPKQQPVHSLLPIHSQLQLHLELFNNRDKLHYSIQQRCIHKSWQIILPVGGQQLPPEHHLIRILRRVLILLMLSMVITKTHPNQV